MTSTPLHVWEGQAQGTPFPVSRPRCSSAQLAHHAAPLHDVQPPYGVRRVELFPPASTGTLMVPASALPIPACTFQVPADTAAPYGLYGSAPLAVPPTMVSSYSDPMVHQPFPTGTYTGMGPVGPTVANYGGSAPYPAHVPGIVPGFPGYGNHNLSASMQPAYSPGSQEISPPFPTFSSAPAPAVRVAKPESNSDSQVGGQVQLSTHLVQLSKMFLLFQVQLPRLSPLLRLVLYSHQPCNSQLGGSQESRRLRDLARLKLSSCLLTVKVAWRRS